MSAKTKGENPNHDHWENDCLKRRRDSQFIRNFLVRRVNERKARGANGSYVLNIDAGWGQGKTFFLERFKTDLEQNHSVAYVNAWEDDYADDPLLSIMVAIETALRGSGRSASFRGKLKAFRKASGKIAVTAAKHALVGFSKKVIGAEGVDAVAQDTAEAIEASAEAAADEIISHHAELALKKFDDAKQTIAKFKKNLSSLMSSSSVKKPLFVLIDELDRCRPLYAISLLERVKHLFEIDDIVFVIATDTEQLRHAVRAVYGNDFDGAGYLLRFFDRTYRFDEPSLEEFIASRFSYYSVPNELLSSPPDDNHIKFFATVAASCGLTLREIERCFDILLSSITVWRFHGQVKLELVYLLPLIIAQCRNDTELTRDLARFSHSVLESRLGRTPPAIDFREAPESQPTHVRVPEIVKRFMEVGKGQLSNVTHARVEPGVSRWINSRFMEEYVALHADGQDQAMRGRSIIRTYPRLVRAVDRFSGSERG